MEDKKEVCVCGHVIELHHHPLDGGCSGALPINKKYAYKEKYKFGCKCKKYRASLLPTLKRRVSEKVS